MDYKKTIHDLIIKAENLMGPGKGAEKKQWVVDQLNALIDVPGIPEWMEERILSELIDVAVFFLFRKIPAVIYP